MTVGDLREWLRVWDAPDSAVVRVDIHSAAIRRPVDEISRSTVNAAVLEDRGGAFVVVADPEHDPAMEKELRSRVEDAGMRLRQATSWEPLSRAVRSDWVIENDDGPVRVCRRLEEVGGWLAEREML